MIGKIITGRSFRGAVEYVLGKSQARLLDSDGVDTASVRLMIDDLNFQRKTRPEIAKVVGHVSLSFHRDDAPKLSDDRMRELAAAYMERMGITDTQYIVVRHNDTEHPHLHIVYNRVRYDKKLVPDKNERRRNVKVCRELKQRYGLTFSKGKEQVKTQRLHGADKVKYEIYEAIAAVLPHCSSCRELAAQLKKKGIQTAFIHRGNDPRKEVQGIAFTKDGHTFKGSKVDRKYSYGALENFIREQAKKQAEESVERELRYILSRRAEAKHEETMNARKTDKPEPELQPAPATKTASVSILTTPPTPPPPSQAPTPTPPQPNPVVFGIRLADEQIARIRDGQPIYLEGMQSQGSTFDGYLIMNDALTYGRAFVGEDPRAWVRYGKYEMRLMDKVLIEAGFITHAVVKWWGNAGETARPYLWKEKPSDNQFRESWGDPRKPKMQEPAVRPKLITKRPKTPGRKL